MRLEKLKNCCAPEATYCILVELNVIAKSCMRKTFIISPYFLATNGGTSGAAGRHFAAAAGQLQTVLEREARLVSEVTSPGTEKTPVTAQYSPAVSSMEVVPRTLEGRRDCSPLCFWSAYE